VSQYSTCHFSLAGNELIACRSGVLWWPAEGTLIVADMHLEKGSAHAKRGTFLPPYDTRGTLRRLKAAVSHWRPRRVVALGDSFHDGEGPCRLTAEDRNKLDSMQEGREWVWIAGNHDPDLPADVSGERAEQFSAAGLTLRHQPSKRGEVAIVGHLHPIARVARDGLTQRRPCFVQGPSLLVLPAFGAYTGGMNVLDPVILGPLGNIEAVAVVARTGVYQVSPALLRV
jgi:DNA ligase-associated metallophosphoesterase